MCLAYERHKNKGRYILRCNMKCKTWLRKHKVLTYLTVACVITVFLFLLENVFGVAIGLIPLGGGGECKTYLSLGGNEVVESFPMSVAGESVSSGGSNDIDFYFLTFAIMFVVRFIIIIPSSNFFLLSDKGDNDYLQEMQNNSRKAC